MHMVAAYISMAEQMSDMDIDSQKQRLTAWAGINGISIHDFYIDNDIDRLTLATKRKEFKRLLRDIKLLGINKILTLQYGDITKNSFEFVSLYNKFRDINVQIVLAS